jgi:hypothetical protein
VLEASILSEGVGSSSGILLLQDDDGKIYIAKTSGDLKTTLEQISTALTHVATALTALDAKPIGTLPPAPAVAANVAAITAVQAALSSAEGGSQVKDITGITEGADADLRVIDCAHCQGRQLPPGSARRARVRSELRRRPRLLPGSGSQVSERELQGLPGAAAR